MVQPCGNDWRIAVVCPRESRLKGYSFDYFYTLLIHLNTAVTERISDADSCRSKDSRWSSVRQRPSYLAPYGVRCAPFCVCRSCNKELTALGNEAHVTRPAKGVTAAGWMSWQDGVVSPWRRTLPYRYRILKCGISTDVRQTAL